MTKRSTNRRNILKYSRCVRERQSILQCIRFKSSVSLAAGNFGSEWTGIFSRRRNSPTTSYNENFNIRQSILLASSRGYRSPCLRRSRYRADLARIHRDRNDPRPRRRSEGAASHSIVGGSHSEAEKTRRSIDIRQRPWQLPRGVFAAKAIILLGFGSRYVVARRAARWHSTTLESRRCHSPTTILRSPIYKY